MGETEAIEVEKIDIVKVAKGVRLKDVLEEARHNCTYAQWGYTYDLMACVECDLRHTCLVRRVIDEADRSKAGSAPKQG